MWTGFCSIPFKPTKQLPDEESSTGVNKRIVMQTLLLPICWAGTGWLFPNADFYSFLGACKMIQQAKILAPKRDDLSLISGTHTVKGEYR